MHDDIDTTCSSLMGVSGTNLVQNLVQFKITSTNKLVITYKGYAGVYISEILGYV